MNSRIRFPFNYILLNPVYVAARSLRSNYKKALPKYVQQKQCFPPTQSPSERKYASSLNKSDISCRFLFFFASTDKNEMLGFRQNSH